MKEYLRLLALVMLEVEEELGREVLGDVFELQAALMRIMQDADYHLPRDGLLHMLTAYEDQKAQFETYKKLGEAVDGIIDN